MSCAVPNVRPAGGGATFSLSWLALDSGSGSIYHRFGVYENGGKLYQATAASTSGGTSYVNPTVLVDGFAAGVWYILELAVDDAAGTRVSVWRADTPSVRYEARWELPANRTWTFRHWAYAGTTWLDDYQELRPAQAGSNSRIVGKHYEVEATSGQVTKRYYANGALLATQTGTTLTYVQGDHLGSTSTLTNGGGNVVGRERYSAFGERRRGESYLITDQLYTGQRLNVLSHLYHYSDGSSAGRFYDPLLGRFVQADPVTPSAGSAGLNRYAYALNSPLVFSDPNGYDPLDAAWEQAFRDEHGGRGPSDEDRRDRLFSLLYEGSGANGSWTDNDWAFYQRNRDDLWGGQVRWPGASAPGIDRFASHAGRLASWYAEDETPQFVRAFALVFAGIRYTYNGRVVPDAMAALEAARGPRLPQLFEGMDGWIPSLVDFPPDSNPAHHYAGLFFLGMFTPEQFARSVNYWRDRENQPDIALGNSAVAHAQIVRTTPGGHWLIPQLILRLAARMI